MANTPILDDGFEEVNLDDGFEEVALEETPDLADGFIDESVPTGSKAQQELAKSYGATYTPTPKELEDRKDIVSSLEAAALHVAPFNTTGIIGGVSGTAGHVTSNLMEGKGLPSLEDLKDTYYEAKEDTQKRQDEALAKHPVASIGGMLAAGVGVANVGSKVASNIPKFGKFIEAVLPTMTNVKRAERIAKVAKKAKDVERLHQTYKKLKSASTKVRLASALSEGGKFGALTALGGGDAKLLEGEIAETAKQTLEGGAYGAGFGGLISGGAAAVRGLGGIFKTRGIIEPYALGKNGMDLTSNERINLSKKLTKALHDDLTKEFERLGSKRSEALKLADEVGTKVNTMDDVANAIAIIDDIGLAETSTDAKAFVNVLNKHLGNSKKMMQVREQMEKKLTKMYQTDAGLDEVAARKLAKKELNMALREQRAPDATETGNFKITDLNPETKFPEIQSKVQTQHFGNKVRLNTADVTKSAPKVTQGIDKQTGHEFIRIKDTGTGKSSILVGGKPVPQLDAEGASLEQVNSLRQMLKGFTHKYSGDNVPYEVKQQATDLRKTLGAIIDKELVGVTEGAYTDINRKFAHLYTALETAGIKQKPMKYEPLYTDQLRSLANLFESQTDEKQTYKVIADFMKQLKKGSPELYNKHKKAIDDLRILSRYAEDPSNKNLGGIDKKSVIVGTIGEQIHKLANNIGRKVKVVGDTKEQVKNTIKGVGKKLAADSPEEIQKIISKIEKGGEKYKQFLMPLEKLKTSKPRTKTAIMYSLMQQPFFRELISTDKENKEDKE